jgi:hypothetical protein
MRRKILRRPSPAMVVAFIALMAALAPTAAALRGVNLVSSNDIITGAVKKSEVGRDAVSSNEVLEDTDTGGGLTGSQIREDRLGTVPEAAGLSHRAFISGADARVVRGEGVRSVSRSAAGEYSVVFDREARSCVYLALLSGDDSGRVVVSDSTTNANAVNVRTFEGGTPTDRSFHLALAC